LTKIEGTYRSQTAKLKINFADIFGDGVRLDGATKEAFLQDAIDMIIERTKNNRSLSGSKFKSPYSDSYANSNDFKAHGKSKNNVNMTLTGDMLDSLDIISISGNNAVIGWEDDTENKKAYNHNTGDTVPKRTFLGLQAKEVSELKDKYKERVKYNQTNKINELGLSTIENMAVSQGIDINEIFAQYFDMDYQV